MKRITVWRQSSLLCSGVYSVPLPGNSSRRAICFSCRYRLATASFPGYSRPLNPLFATKRTASSNTVASAINLDASQSTPPVPDISSHYSIFPDTLPLGPPPTGPFNIDHSLLRAEFLRLQGKFHPDKYSPGQKQQAEALSARINEAYRTLQDPLMRAQYLLSHSYGIDVASEDNSSHPADPGTLMEVMEAQESIEEAETVEQIAALKEQNQSRIEATLKLLDEAFDTGDVEAARTETIRLRYWASLAEGLNAWDGKGSEVRLVH